MYHVLIFFKTNMDFKFINSKSFEQTTNYAKNIVFVTKL